MSVLMMFRVKGDAKKLEELAAERTDVLPAIAEDAKRHGLIRHRFYGTDDEILVVDEWPTAEAFQEFFAAHPEIQEMMAQVGVTTQPEVTFWRKLATNDDVG